MNKSDTGQTVAAVIDRLKRQFAQQGVADPVSDARILTGGILGLDLTALVLQADRPVSFDEKEQIAAAAKRRGLGEPVHRILGARSFFGLEIRLSEATLEPRPDTETLVEAALPLARAVAERSHRCDILDLGTGSGAICLALLTEVGVATGVATDISVEALQAAQGNAERLGLADRFQTVESDWFADVDGIFNLIVSNPPYIRSGEIPLLDPEVRKFDPLLALDGGADGLSAYRAIARGADSHLKPGGHLMLETGFDQHDAVVALFGGHGFVCRSRVQDLGGQDRVLIFGRADEETT